MAAAIILFGAAASANLGDTQACSISPDTNVVRYDGVGTGKYSTQWEDHFWTWWGQANKEIKVAKVSGPNLATKAGCRLGDHPNVKVYVQPGGDAYDMQDSIKAQGRENILDFMQQGGKYVGTCAGWYLASQSYIWQNQTYNWPNLLGLFEETVEGSITTIADYAGTPPYKLTPITTDVGTLNAIYYGGPTVGWVNTAPRLPSPAWKQIASFNAPHVVGDPAVVTKKDVLLFSTHFEAYEGVGVTTLTTKDRLANYQYRARQINALLNTNWTIPATP